MLAKIGFLLNEEKSDLVPTQFPDFLGASLNLQKALASPSRDRISRLHQIITNLLARPVATAREWRSLFGHLASMIYLVPHARQHIRPLQLFVHSQWSETLPDSAPIRLSDQAVFHLQWWLVTEHLTIGAPFSRPDPQVTIVTDASSSGWGGHLGDQRASGDWSVQWSQRHINWLELQAVWLTMKHFAAQLQGLVVEVLSDNSTTVSYINKQGGTHSPSLCNLALDFWDWCDCFRITPVAVHLQGVKNVLADALSRGKFCPTEWSLHRPTTMSLFRLWGTPMVDLFATNKNAKLPVFYSLHRDPAASAINALTTNWDALIGYAYPPIALLPRVLRKLSRHPSAVLILIAPFWPSQIWFRPLTKLLIDFPRKLPVRWNLLKNSETGELYPAPEKLRLTAWRVSADPSLHRDFLTQLPNWQSKEGENRPEGFMIPVLPTSLDGALAEKWIPILPL